MRSRGLALAASAAAVFVTTGCGGQEAADGGQVAKVKCEGVNDCKGQSACETATSDCSGQNECKGKGWIELTAAECTEAGGKEKAS